MKPRSPDARPGSGIRVVALGMLFATTLAAAHSPHDDVFDVAVSPDFLVDETAFAIVRSNLLRTRDGGKSWHRITRGLDFVHTPVRMAVAPDARTLYIVTIGDGIFRSTDAGDRHTGNLPRRTSRRLRGMTIRTRFAPSPTGVLHIGSVRTALFCWLYARRHEGTFILRIEDTDHQRSTPENVHAILDGLEWLGLRADEGPYYQAQRFARYAEVVEQWLASGKAYRCYCSRDELEELRARQKAAGQKTRYDGRCREQTEPRAGVDPVVRFRNPTSGDVVVNDLVRGRVVFSNAELDDLIIARSDGAPTYNFTVVVDDSDMMVTHVIRGDDHLNNTPRQMNMLAALGVDPPAYAHLPMILGPDGAKLSKRHGAIDVRDYREQGYLPEALLNYLVRLGWSHGDQEIFTLDEMMRLFDISDVNASASAFNPEKLTWLNQQHIIAMPAEELGRRLLPYLRQIGLREDNGPDPARVAEGFRERAETLVQMAASCRYCYEDFAAPDPAAAKKHLRPVVLEPLKDITGRFRAMQSWSEQEIGQQIEDSASAHGLNLGKLGQPIRVAVTGGPVSPPIDVTLALVGQARTVARLERAIGLVEVRATPSV